LTFFRGSSLRGFRRLLRADRARFALRHHRQQRLEKQRLEDEIENQNQNDSGQSAEKEFA
jgi:hypothetical protein